jgi:predicted secreted protein
MRERVERTSASARRGAAAGPAVSAGVPVAVLCALLGAALAVGGCAGGARPAEPASAAVVLKASGQKTLTVGIDNAGAVVELERGQQFVVRLGLDTTTGHEWELTQPVGGVLEVVGPSFERYAKNISEGESAGSSNWAVRALAAGSAVLRFELRRPRRIEPPRLVVNYAVTVR